MLTAAAAVVIRPRPLGSAERRRDRRVLGERAKSTCAPCASRRSSNRTPSGGSSSPPCQFEITRQKGTERSRYSERVLGPPRQADLFRCTLLRHTALFQLGRQVRLSLPAGRASGEPIAERERSARKAERAATSTAKSRAAAATHTLAICSTTDQSRQGLRYRIDLRVAPLYQAERDREMS